ncbi:T9SS type A sorting domain-containing protein [Kordia sp.]|uniref:T9SS type A sorting domain-containing protein n=1 Tax=Kordia sp. TaxID=1965332 RepID=UPI003D287E32
MKYKKLKIMTFCFLFGTGFLCAQQSVNAGGGNATGATGNTSFSVGQLFYKTNSGATGSTAQGVQQSFEISTTLGIEVIAIQLEAIAFPNPTTDFINLRLKNMDVAGLSYQISDISGRLLISKKLTGDTTKIPMKQLPVATYFISIVEKSKKVKTFKIIKK